MKTKITIDFIVDDKVYKQYEQELEMFMENLWFVEEEYGINVTESEVK